MCAPLGLSPWSLWGGEEGQAVGSLELCPDLRGGCSDPAPLFPLPGQSVVPEPQDEVEACEGRSARLPSWAGP